MKRLVLGTIALAATVLAAMAQQRRAGDFDFYVLALSWSPSYCAAEGGRADRRQCGEERGFGFVVHGLWPQYERGFPRECRTAQRQVSERLARSMTDIMPSARLVNHQWRMHGSCSGLSQQAYFETTREALGRVAIPQRFQGLREEQRIAASIVEGAFLKANPGMPGAGVSVDCGGGLMREVRICLTKNLDFRACPEVERRACKAGGLLMPPAR